MQFWNELEPGRKRLIVIAGVVGAAVLVMLALGGKESESGKERRPESIKRVLGDRDTRKFGIQELQSKIKGLQKDRKDLERGQDRLKGELSELKSRTGSNAELNRKVTGFEGKQSKLVEELRDLTQQLKSVRQELADVRSESEKALRQSTDAREKAALAREEVKAGGGAPSGQSPSQVATPSDTRWQGTNVKSSDGDDPMKYFASAALPTEGDQNAKTQSRSKKDGGSGIRVIGGTESTPDVVEETKDEGIYIPAGSMMTGVLLNGMDAPTKTEASKNPFPATLRLQHEAILPNYYTADVRECFLITSGYGDLSAERAYLRGETISCVREDGGVVEASIKGYATGEDGKAGVRGRLVSKSGQIIGQAMRAGFLEGLAGAFKTQQVPVVQTTGVTDTPIFQQAFSEETLSNGLLSGSGKALERIADYYLRLAEEVFPVIEIDAGREISFTLTKGSMLKFKSKAG